MQRKAALVGRANGPWVRTLGMTGLRLVAKVRGDTMLKVTQRSGDSIGEKVFVGAGSHALDDSEWTQVFIADGYYPDALCLLEGG